MRALAVLMPLTAGALSLAALPARAADSPPISVSVPACPSAPFAVEAFLGSLEVELAGQTPACCLLAPPGNSKTLPANGLTVALSIDPCDATAAAVVVRVSDPTRASGGERRVELADIPPEARPRALALAAAELVHATLLAPIASAPPPRATPAPTPEAERARAPRSSTLFLSGTVELETHPGNNLLLWGLGASAALARGRWMGALDLQVLNDDSSVALGDVTTWLVAASATAGPRLSLGRSVLTLGATGRLGWASMSGHTTDPSAMTGSGSTLVASAGGRVEFLLPTQARVSYLRALVEAGGMLRGLEATVNDTAAASLSGGYLLFGLGFGENR